MVNHRTALFSGTDPCGQPDSHPSAHPGIPPGSDPSKFYGAQLTFRLTSWRASGLTWIFAGILEY